MSFDRVGHTARRSSVERIVRGATGTLWLILAGALLTFGPGAAPASRSEPGPSSPGVKPGTLYCPVCGAQNEAGNRFCLKDGTALPTLNPARQLVNFTRSPGTFTSQEIQEVMQRVSASVVRIRARTTTTYRYPIAYWQDEEAEYFGRAMRGRIETSETDARLTGSGFVISSDGAIVTNAHVARPDGLEADLTVETGDGRRFPARLIAHDPASDLALVKIDDGSIAPLPWGDSKKIRLGQEAWAIGYPLDIGLSIARGTISGVTGMRIGVNQIESFMHSDAHIAPGNSGGPVVNVSGEVLGVSDITFSASKGQGYSIPASMARLVIERLEREGGYDRGFIGLHVRPVDSDAIEKYSLKRQQGSVVISTLPDSPARAAGFKPGDVVYGINGRLARSTYILQEAIASFGPGEEINIRLDRGGESLVLPVQTILRPASPRIDPIEQLESHLRIWFEEDDKKRVIIRDPNRSRRAPGLYDRMMVRSVLPAQDWPDEPITLNYYRTRAKSISIDSLDDLRTALKRAYLGGRMAVTFEVNLPSAPIASVAFDELWPIIL